MILLHDTGLTYRGRRAYHLGSTEGLDELHAFAKKLGLKREWFQDKPRHPHYDIISSKKIARAQELGAHEVTGKEYISMVYRG